MVIAAAVMAATAISADGAAAKVAAGPAIRAAPVVPAVQSVGTAPPAATGTPIAAPVAAAKAEAEPVCARLKGVEACVGPDSSSRPGVTVEDTRDDHMHPAVEYYLNGYLGTKYVIHNLGRKGEVRGSREIGKVVTFRAALYRGDRRVGYGRWKTVRNVAKYPVKRDSRTTPAAARAKSEVCTATKGAASVCFAERHTFVYACDTGADRYQARAEYFVGGDPTTRYEIHQLAGAGTCGKAEHGDLSISMYRASLFDENHRKGTRLYKYN
ncbi:hypothetical protein OIE67_51280 [Nonomuraea fuscirosea]|uniref:hypothetical protein n=1 Tax=Nonomuraea fuscirosea TaxID=1291556 RepID=UPI002DDA757E|nr:hypothetical protein [Nonomuraea fuscirosea]WSA52322.1 hypothetical protein OIE67_51280 [Nonomuraea fuscirosea]